MTSPFILALILMTFVHEGEGHGYLKDPASRSSRFKTDPTSPKNFGYNGLNCGGRNVQHFTNGGKCGPCGDEFSLSIPRPNEAGGKWVPTSRTVYKTYRQADVINVQVVITAPHKGWFEFRLCPHNDFIRPVEQECFDQNLLKIAGTDSTRFEPANGIQDTTYDIPLQLPADLTCTLCVLQWLYNTGNSWGTDPATGKGKLGNGPQEQFINCADIAILSTSDALTPSSKTGTGTGKSGVGTSTGESGTGTGTVISETGTGSSLSGTGTGSDTFSTGTGTDISGTGIDKGVSETDSLVKECDPGYIKYCTSISGDTSMNTWCSNNCRLNFCPERLCKKCECKPVVEV